MEHTQTNSSPLLQNTQTKHSCWISSLSHYETNHRKVQCLKSAESIYDLMVSVGQEFGICLPGCFWFRVSRVCSQDVDQGSCHGDGRSPFQNGSLTAGWRCLLVGDRGPAPRGLLH